MTISIDQFLFVDTVSAILAHLQILEKPSNLSLKMASVPCLPVKQEVLTQFYQQSFYRCFYLSTPNKSLTTYQTLKWYQTHYKINFTRKERLLFEADLCTIHLFFLSFIFMREHNLLGMNSFQALVRWLSQDSCTNITWFSFDMLW